MKNRPKDIIFCLAGTKLLDKEKEFFLKAKPLGFILFSRNIASREQLITLTKSLRELFPKRKTFIFVDQEGGRVARIKPPLAKKLYPAAKTFGDIYLADPAEAKKSVKENYLQIMGELNSLGIDSPCAPVCDIYYKEASSVIGDRSFGSTPGQVIDLCKEAIAGINEQAGIAFMKHIPGHGRAKVDSHFALPIINTDLKTLEETDFKVFKTLSKEKVWGMTAHIVYHALDPKKPATLSNKVIDYIRNQIGFKGILVTDDIRMSALHGKVGQQKSLLIKISCALQHKEWENEQQKKFKELFTEDFKKLFAIDITEKNRQEIIDIYQKQQELIKASFRKSLADVTKEAIVAGCDVVLYGDPNLQDMEAIYRAVETYQPINHSEKFTICPSHQQASLCLVVAFSILFSYIFFFRK